VPSAAFSLRAFSAISASFFAALSRFRLYLPPLILGRFFELSRNYSAFTCCKIFGHSKIEAAMTTTRLSPSFIVEG